MGDTDRKLFVLDTNILLHEPLAIYSFQEHDVVVPMTVLQNSTKSKTANATSHVMPAWLFVR